MTNSISVCTAQSGIRPATAGNFAVVVKRFIRDHYAPVRYASKKLARDASWGSHKVSARTAEQWLRRGTLPGLDSIEILSARCEILRGELAKERERLNASIAESVVRDTARHRGPVSTV